MSVPRDEPVVPGRWVEVDDPRLALDDVPVSQELPTRRALLLLAAALGAGLVFGLVLRGLHLRGGLVLAAGVKLASAAVALTAVERVGWLRRGGFVRPRVPKRLLLAWLPLVYLLLASGFRLPHRSAGTTLAVVGLCLTVGLEEELWTRGVLLETLRHRGTTAAVVWSALFFGLLHGVNVLGGQPVVATLVQMFVAASFGLALGAIRVRTGSLWPTIAIHATWDAVLILRTGEIGAATSPGLSTVLVTVLLFTPMAVHGLVLARPSQVPGPDGRMPRQRRWLPPWAFPSPPPAPASTGDALGRWPSPPPELAASWARRP